ncbi:MAG: glucose 1-dehydrogenase [Chloroflexi bacterium]|nr:glucose 1-dehydrogenase [Chloroflexota bacterium]
MDLGLKGKIAIVTGGGRGLGKAIALDLGAEGAHVVVADINVEAAKGVATQVGQTGGKALAVTVDVSKADQVQAMVAEALQEFGRVDILVNNAGIVGPQRSFVDLAEEGWDLVVAINLKGVFLCSKVVLPHMIEQKSGKITHIASIAGKTGEPFNGVYSATKAGVISLTQSMALECARHNINVNAVCPAAMDTDVMAQVYRERSKYLGLTPTEMKQKVESSFPLPRTLTVGDVARLVLFLASESSSMITGEAVNISGGVEVH